MCVCVWITSPTGKEKGCGSSQPSLHDVWGQLWPLVTLSGEFIIIYNSPRPSAPPNLPRPVPSLLGTCRGWQRCAGVGRGVEGLAEDWKQIGRSPGVRVVQETRGESRSSCIGVEGLREVWRSVGEDCRSLEMLESAGLLFGSLKPCISSKS